MPKQWTEAAQRPPEAAETDLVARLQGGEAQAFAELLERFEKPVFRFAYGFFRDRDEALEVVQETFLRVYRKIDRYQPEHSLGSWIMRIAYNLCIDQYRRQRRRRHWNEPLDESRHQPAAEEEAPEERLTNAAAWREIERALPLLSAKQRAVFELRHGQGLKLEDIASTLGVTVGTVKTLHHRALKVIRCRVAATWGGGT